MDSYTQKQKELVAKMKKMFAQNQHGSGTVVERKDNYVDSEELTLTTIVFITKNIIDIIAQKILEPLKSIEPDHYYYPAESTHLTIKSIRYASNPPGYTEQDIEKVNNLFQSIVSEFDSFTFSLEGLTRFPNSLSLMGYSNDSLKDLVLALDQGLKDIGVPDNKKYFSDEIFFGNVTLCRFTHDPGGKFLAKVKELEEVQIGELEIKELSLVTSDAVCSSASKKIINTYNLK